MEELLTLEEVADAWKVSPHQLGVWSRDGKIEGAEKKGRLWRYQKTAKYVDKPAAPRKAKAHAEQRAEELLARIRDM
jgi:hypothetical protein